MLTLDSFKCTEYKRLGLGASNFPLCYKTAFKLPSDESIKIKKEESLLRLSDKLGKAH